MEPFSWLARPWWVNLLFVVPFAAFWSWRRRALQLGLWTLVYGFVFAASFGFVEAAVVVYIRQNLSQMMGQGANLADVARQSTLAFQQTHVIPDLPPSILRVEMAREAATIFMLVAVALLCADRLRERCAAFLWLFAAWDISYYAGLRLTLGWPESLTSSDILFLIPEPWLAQVWFPLLVSGLTMLAVAASSKQASNEAPLRATSAAAS